MMVSASLSLMPAGLAVLLMALQLSGRCGDGVLAASAGTGSGSSSTSAGRRGFTSASRQAVSGFVHTDHSLKDPTDSASDGPSLTDDSASSDYGDVISLQCNASIMDVLKHSMEMAKLAEDSKVLGVILDFVLHVRNESCDRNASELQDENLHQPELRTDNEPCTKYTEISVECDGLLAANSTTPSYAPLIGNLTKATRYFHPLQQIWTRRKSPTALVSLPPDRVALSMTLLSDDLLQVRHLRVPISVASEQCWRSLTQADQSSITFTLGESTVFGLSALQLGNNTGQLCQLRYSSRAEYALYVDSNTNLTNEQFAFSCCHSDTPGTMVTCSKTSAFSKWDSGDNLIVFLGLMIAVLFGPLSFLSKLVSSGPVAMATTASNESLLPVRAQSASINHAEIDGEEAFAYTPSESDRLLPGGPISQMDRDGNETDSGLVLGEALAAMPAITTTDLLAMCLKGSPYATHTAPAEHSMYMVVGGGDAPSTTCVQAYQVVERLKWFGLLCIPLLLIALRATAYRASSTNKLLSCMLPLDMPTPWMVFLYGTDYAFLAVYLVFALLFMLANPARLYSLLLDQPSVDSHGHTLIFPPRPSAYNLPDSNSRDGSDNCRIENTLLHVKTVFLEKSLTRRVYNYQKAGDKMPYSLMVTLCCCTVVPDVFLLFLLALLVIFHNTPTGYLLIHLSKSAGNSITLSPGHTALQKAIAFAESIIWFLECTAALLLVLLSATWVVATLQYTAVGILYNISDYLGRIIQILSFLLYLYHYWTNMRGSYVNLQRVIAEHYQKILHEEQLMNRIISGVAKKMNATVPPTPVKTTASMQKEIFARLVAKHYPVRFYVMKTLLAFVVVCAYLAAMNATVIMTSSVHQLSGYMKALALAAGSVLPKVVEFLSDDKEQVQQVRNLRVQRAVRRTMTAAM